MVSWQRRSSLGRRRVTGVTAFGRLSSFPLSPLTGPPAVLGSSPARLGRLDRGAMLNFALTEFSEVHIPNPHSPIPCGSSCIHRGLLWWRPRHEKLGALRGRSVWG